MIPYFQHLGEAVEAAWAAAGREPEQLPAVASQALRAAPAHEHTSIDEVLGWVSAVPAEAFPPQPDMLAAFGDPPVTVYWGGDFRIDVNLWATSTTAIHQHAFAGAFQVLHGSSLESQYGFVETRRVSEDLRLGELELHSMHVRRVGDVSEIPPGPAYIHALFHLDHPSATVVVRSNGDAAYLPQLGYDAPGVAYNSELDRVFGPLAHRRLQLVQLLAHTRRDDMTAVVERMLEGADPLWAYHLLAATLPRALAGRGIDFATLDATMSEWFDRVQWSDAELKQHLRDGARHRVRGWDVQMRRSLFLEPDDRLIAAVLVNAPDRAAVSRCLAQEFPDAEPVQTLLGFIDRGYELRDAFQPAVCALGLHETSVGVLRMMVAQDQDFDGVLAGIAAANPDVDLEPQLESLRQRDSQLRTYGLFASWFSGRP